MPGFQEQMRETPVPPIGKWDIKCKFLSNGIEIGLFRDSRGIPYKQVTLNKITHIVRVHNGFYRTMLKQLRGDYKEDQKKQKESFIGQLEAIE